MKYRKSDHMMCTLSLLPEMVELIIVETVARLAHLKIRDVRDLHVGVGRGVTLAAVGGEC